MRKADLILAALMVAALAASALGAINSDAWTGERTIRFVTATVPLGDQEPVAVSATPGRLEWNLPNNATSIRLNVTVTFAGQAVQGGSATVSLRATTPDGKTVTPATASLAIPQGATSATASFSYNATWANVPATTDDTRVPASVVWGMPFVLEITVERPADVGIATYSFMGAATGSTTTYAAT